MSSGTRRVSPLASDFFLLFSLTPDVRRARRRGLLKIMSPETPKQLVPSVHLTHVWRTLGDMVPWPWPSQTGDIPAAFSQGIWLCGQRSVSTVVGGGGTVPSTPGRSEPGATLGHSAPFQQDRVQASVPPWEGEPLLSRPLPVDR